MECQTLVSPAFRESGKCRDRGRRLFREELNREGAKPLHDDHRARPGQRPQRGFRREGLRHIPGCHWHHRLAARGGE